MASDADLAYLGGFFDGEGSVSISGDVLRVSIGQINPAPLERYKYRWGGRLRLVKKTSPHRDIYHWTIESAKAAGVLEELLPYLIVKRDQAILGMNFQWMRHADRRPVSEDEKSIRKVMAATLRFLNKERSYS